MLQITLGNWSQLDGLAVDRGVDLSGLPPDRLVNWVLHVLYEGADEKRRAELDRKLRTPPAGVEGDPGGVWSADQQAGAFAAVAALAGGGGASP